jgi:hypothetical protein
MLVQLVEVTTVDELVDRLKKGKHKSGSEIMQKSQFFPTSFLLNPHTHFETVAASVNEDDDIVSGSSKISLKCPVSRFPSPAVCICNSKVFAAELYAHTNTITVLDMRPSVLF